MPFARGTVGGGGGGGGRGGCGGNCTFFFLSLDVSRANSVPHRLLTTSICCIPYRAAL